MGEVVYELYAFNAIETFRTKNHHAVADEAKQLAGLGDAAGYPRTDPDRHADFLRSLPAPLHGRSSGRRRRHGRMRRFEVPEDNGFIAECVRLLGLRIRHKDIMLIVFQPEHIVETATILGRERRRRWRISAMQAGTTPKKRTSLNGRAALKLMRLDGARRADQAASDARVTKASSSIAVALLLISSGASATECQSSPGHDGKWWSYRIVDSKRCWYQGRPGRSKDLLQWAKQSPPPVVTRPDPGDSPPPAPPVPPQQPTETVDTTPKVVSTVSIPAPTSEAPQMAAPPPSLPEPPPLPAKPTKPSKWWMLLLIIPAIATGLAVVASQFQPARRTLFKNFRRRWTNWQARLAGHLDLMGDNITQWSRRASRPVQIDPTSPSSERPSPSGQAAPSSSLTTFDPKSLRKS